MRVVDIWSSGKKPTISFEVFPPRSPKQAENLEKDLEYLKLKVEKGAEYIICNYFYDNQYFFDFLGRCKDADITVPIGLHFYTMDRSKAAVEIVTRLRNEGLM